MIVLFRKNNILCAKVLMELRLPIHYKNKEFGKGKKELYLEPEEVLHILTKNGNIRIFNGEKYIKLNLGQFYEIIQQNKYLVEEVPVVKEEPVKVEVKEEVKVVEEKPAPVVKEEPVKVEVKEEVKVVEEVKEQPKENKQYENKKQRHNNNKQNNQGGDK